MSARLHPVAWLAWLAAAGGVAVTLRGPIPALGVIAVALWVGASAGAVGPEGRTYVLFVKIALLFLAFRVVLFALTGHTGPTTIATLPSIGLPSWLGGLSLGGRITAEVAASAVAEGLTIAALLVCTGVFLSVVETYRIIRALPRFLFDAGLVVTIALTFVPSVMRSVGAVRDAQRMRGHRFRGVRTVRPLVVPVLADALERSMTLAASMEIRGFGRGPLLAEGVARRARASVLAGILAVTAGASALLFGLAGGVIVLVAGAIALTWGLRTLGSAVARTRYRAERLTGWDVATIVAAACAVAAAIALRGVPGAAWSAYPVATWPAIDPRAMLPALLVGAPIAVGGLRARVLRRASALQPVGVPR